MNRPHGSSDLPGNCWAILYHSRMHALQVNLTGVAA